MVTRKPKVYKENGQFVVRPAIIHVPIGQSTIIWKFDSSVPQRYRFDRVIAMSSLASIQRYTVTDDGRTAEAKWLNTNTTTNVANTVTYTLIITEGETTFRAMAERSAPEEKSKTLVDPEISNDPKG